MIHKEAAPKDFKPLFITAAVFGVMLVAVFLYRNSWIQSRLHFYKMKWASTYTLYQEAESLSLNAHIKMPEVRVEEEKEKVPFAQMPKTLQLFARPTWKSTLKEIIFKDDGSKGFLLEDHEQQTCPKWQNILVGDLRLQTLRRTKNLVRYEFRSNKEMVFAETKQGPLGCQIEIYVRVFTRGKVARSM